MQHNAIDMHEKARPLSGPGFACTGLEESDYMLSIIT